MYLVTNTVNGKTYAGITGRGIKRRWSEHKCHANNKINQGAFYRAIRKYGTDCFVISEVSWHQTKDEAKAEEIRYIAQHKPKYNSTLGGDGQLGRVLSKESRLKISKSHIGRTNYHTGPMHSEETKQFLRDKGLRDIEKFKQYSFLGPEACSKKVICLDDWMIFPSASSAARSYNVAKSAVIELCLKKRNRKTVGGFKFAYAQEVL